MEPVGAAEFERLMAPLGPFEPEPRLAVAVSGGADSLALALLTHGWTASRAGSACALIVDHALRPEATAEAEWAARILQKQGLQARILGLGDLPHGSALAARARKARYQALAAACSGAGILHLLLGHHAADQAETVLIRGLGGSGPAGFAGMAALTETHAVRLLRPLLAVPPGRLRATLRAAGMPWIEDPSNFNSRALRARLRAERRDRDGAGAATLALCAAAAAAGAARAAWGAALADALAAGASLRPEGFAILSGQRLPADALAALMRVVAGRDFPPSPARVARLAAAPRPATLAGTRLVPAGRLGPGMLLVREARAMAAPVPAVPGATWDQRFRLLGGTLPPGATIGAVGRDARFLRHLSPLPACVLADSSRNPFNQRAFRGAAFAISAGTGGRVPPHPFQPAGSGAERLFCPGLDPAGRASVMRVTHVNSVTGGDAP